MNDIYIKAGGNLIALFAIILVIIQLYNVIWSFRSKSTIIWHVIVCLNFILGFILMSFLIEGVDEYYDIIGDFSYAAPVRRLLSLPWQIIVAVEIICLIICVISFKKLLKLSDKNIQISSIKEVIDSFPNGICFSEKEGIVLLSNLKMNDICRQLSKEHLRDADDLWRFICDKGEIENNKRFIKTDSDEMYVFSQSSVIDGEKEYIQMIAIDITKQYLITKELENKQEKLRDINMRVKTYQAKVRDVVISREILNARRIVHDNVGHALLAAKYYFDHPEKNDKNALILMMKQVNSLLLRDVEESVDLKKDYYMDALKIADAIGVKIEQEGDVPKDLEVRNILGHVIHECAANAVKHAEGDCLYVTIDESEKGYNINVTNNGYPPGEKIVETGGLLSLRHIIESKGGTMKVESVPTFKVTINLKKSCIDYMVESVK